MTAASSLLGRLASRQPIEDTVAIVVAHPDDETIGAGAIMPLFRRLVLVHVTDGAPRNLADARAHGFTDAASYAAARRAELGQALQVAGVAQERVELGASDQGASGALLALTHALHDVMAQHGVTAVLTHPYEGGHPDHDATAFIVAHCGRPVLEFASYHAGPDGGVESGRFLKPSPLGRGLGGGSGNPHHASTSKLPHPGPLPEGEGEEVRLLLTLPEQRRKRAMLACFTTQAATLAPFGTDWERFRPAPVYDFTQAPHPGPLYYERYDWGMTGHRWRILAADARRALC